MFLYSQVSDKRFMTFTFYEQKTIGYIYIFLIILKIITKHDFFIAYKKQCIKRAENVFVIKKKMREKIHFLVKQIYPQQHYH